LLLTEPWLTDPWLVGSVFWRRWWPQNYPDPATLDWLAGSDTSTRIIFTRHRPSACLCPLCDQIGVDIYLPLPQPREL